MSKFGKVLLISSSIIAATALAVFGCKKLVDSMELPDFKEF